MCPVCLDRVPNVHLRFHRAHYGVPEANLHLWLLRHPHSVPNALGPIPPLLRFSNVALFPDFGLLLLGQLGFSTGHSSLRLDDLTSPWR